MNRSITTHRPKHEKVPEARRGVAGKVLAKILAEATKPDHKRPVVSSLPEQLARLVEEDPGQIQLGLLSGRRRLARGLRRAERTQLARSPKQVGSYILRLSSSDSVSDGEPRVVRIDRLDPDQAITDDGLVRNRSDAHSAKLSYKFAEGFGFRHVGRDGLVPLSVHAEQDALSGNDSELAGDMVVLPRSYLPLGQRVVAAVMGRVPVAFIPTEPVAPAPVRGGAHRAS